VEEIEGMEEIEGTFISLRSSISQSLPSFNQCVGDGSDGRDGRDVHECLRFP